MTALDDLARDLLSRIASLETKVETLQKISPIPSYATLAAAGAFGNAGRVIYVVADGKLYRDTGTAWKSTEIA